MSVGVQRLRDEPDRIRQGAIDKGEDPTTVDRALEVDAARRRLQAESDTCKAERNTASKQVGEAIRGGASPDGPEVAGLRAASTAAGERIAAIDAELAAAEAELDDLMLRIPNPADPDVPVGGEEANVTVRTWGEPGGHEVTTRRHDLDPSPPLGDRRGARHHRQRARREGRGLGVPGLQGRGIAAPARPDLLVPRCPHDGARLHRGLAAGRRQRRVGARHRPDPRQGRPDVRRHARRAVPGPHGRGPGLEPPPRRDPRGRGASHPVRGVHALLPARGRRRRQGHPRHPARPPVRQGRDGAVREARGQPPGARMDDGARARSSCSGSGSPTASC